MFRGHVTSHWCKSCIDSSPHWLDQGSGRVRVRTTIPPGPPQLYGDKNQMPPFVEPIRIEVIGIGPTLSRYLASDPELVHQLSPNQFEEFICDRLFAMGMEPRRTGNVNQRDGGIDIFFWPRGKSSFPFLGAAQVKHHRNSSKKEGTSTVRNLVGALADHPISAAMLVTNTFFTADAQWYARERAKLIRLRDYDDITRWLNNRFGRDEDWREIPKEIELGPGLVFKLRD